MRQLLAQLQLPPPMLDVTKSFICECIGNLNRTRTAA